tara:strand:+ start:610 stop:996 length:387 start_codon:yes stop_codon:yes gene_type:complete
MAEEALEFGFWTFGNLNGLQGSASTQVELPDGRKVIQKDPNNPAVLEDYFIVNAIHTSLIARKDFTRLFPSLDADSQERLTTLVRRNPRPCALLLDDQDFLDAIQRKEATAGVRTEIPMGRHKLPGGL